MHSASVATDENCSFATLSLEAGFVLLGLNCWKSIRPSSTAKRHFVVRISILPPSSRRNDIRPSGCSACAGAPPVPTPLAADLNPLFPLLHFFVFIPPCIGPQNVLQR